MNGLVDEFGRALLTGVEEARIVEEIIGVTFARIFASPLPRFVTGCASRVMALF